MGLSFTQLQTKCYILISVYLTCQCEFAYTVQHPQSTQASTRSSTIDWFRREQSSFGVLPDKEFFRNLNSSAPRHEMATIVSNFVSLELFEPNIDNLRASCRLPRVEGIVPDNRLASRRSVSENAKESKNVSSKFS